jgi:uncharacterized protein YdhG (YjbR/CyaY superfamily)
MAMSRKIAKDMDDYISDFPKKVQALLQQVRNTIKNAAPGVEERISYGIPAFNLNNRYLIYFAGFKNHISVYPAPRGSEEFKEKLAQYKGGKGTVQFPLDKPLPLGLITQIVKFKVKETKKKMSLRVCPKGHRYNKTSDCPTCPICEAQRKPTEGFLTLLSAPARRALENKHIASLEKLSEFSEKEILQLHGMGQGSIPKLRYALKAVGLDFKT